MKNTGSAQLCQLDTNGFNGPQFLTHSILQGHSCQIN